MAYKIPPYFEQAPSFVGSGFIPDRADLWRHAKHPPALPDHFYGRRRCKTRSGGI